MTKKSTSTATATASAAVVATPAAVAASAAPATDDAVIADTSPEAPAERVSAAIDKVLAAGDLGRFVMHLRSSRAPYRRGGVAFGSTRETITLRDDDARSYDLRAIMGDGVIVVTLGDEPTGRTVEVPSELRVRAAGGDPEAFAQLAELAAGLVTEEEKKD